MGTFLEDNRSRKEVLSLMGYRSPAGQPARSIPAAARQDDTAERAGRLPGFRRGLFCRAKAELRGEIGHRQMNRQAG